MSTSISGQAGPGTHHLRGHAAGSGREAARVDLTRDSEESQDCCWMKKTIERFRAGHFTCKNTD